MTIEFLKTHSQFIETQLERYRTDLLAAENNFDSKTQQLQRTYNATFKDYVTFNERLQKNAQKQAETKKSAAPEIPESWKSDPTTFAKEALNMELYDHQKRFCLSEKRTTVLIAGRGAGKSHAACVVALFRAITNVRHTALVVSSGQRMSSDFGGKIFDLIRDTPVRDWVRTASTEQVAFKNGSVIKLLPANPDTIRGYHPKPLEAQAGITVVLDEACFMENGDEIRKAVEYALITAPKDRGRLYIVSSPSSTGSWVYGISQSAADDATDIAVIQCPSSANPAILPTEIERLRKTKTELEFRAEVLGEWVDGAYSLFTGLIEPNIVKPSNEELRYAIYALGADLALSYGPNSDANALAVVAQWYPDDDLEPRYRVEEIQILDRASDGEMRKIADRLIEKHDVKFAAVEQYQGKGLCEYCQSLKVETQLINPTAGLQQEIFHELHRLMRFNLIEFPNNLPKKFFEELKMFEYKRNPNGQTTFGHPHGGHDDSVYALAWAVHAARSVPPPKPIDPVIPPILWVPKR